jgi:hypothetical protein
MISHPRKPNSRERLGTVDLLCLIIVFSRKKPLATAASIDCLSLASLSILVQCNVLAYLGSFVSYKELKCCENALAWPNVIKLFTAVIYESFY